MRGKPMQRGLKPPRPELSPRPPADTEAEREEKARLVREYLARRGVTKLPTRKVEE